MLILIVDDEVLVRNLLVTYLSPKYTCVTAASADEAVKLMEERSFDLVITDITMPGMSGIELCNYVRKRYSETAVVVISALTDMAESVRNCAFAFVKKPFDLSQVAMVIERAVKKKR